MGRQLAAGFKHVGVTWDRTIMGFILWYGT